MRRLILLSLVLMVAGCSSMFQKHVEWTQVPPDQYPVLTAVGYAPISTQPGRNDNERMLNALKASKVEAYRELAEQIHGRDIQAYLQLNEAQVNSEALRTEVRGLVRGAKVVRSYAVGDNYATELELNMADLQRIYLITSPVQRVKDVQYY